MEFDYVKAWRELASPAYQTLPQKVKDVYLHSVEISEKLQQGANLCVSIPDSFHCRLRDLDSSQLSAAAHIIYCCGHWKPTGEGFVGAGQGAHWKFANMADQVLRESLNLPQSKNGDSPIGKSHRVIDGFLRLCLNSPWNWTWQEIGLADAKTLDAAKSLPIDVRPTGRRSRRLWDEWQTDAEAKIKEALSELRPSDIDCLPLIGKFFDLSAYMK